jgi:hypothetical protein
MKKMLDRTERRFDLKPKQLAADTAYGTGRFVGSLVDHRITLHISVRDASDRADGTDGEALTSARMTRCSIPPERCMTAKCFVIVLRNSTVIHVRSKCSAANTPARQVPRDINEYARGVARRLMRTKPSRKHVTSANVLKCVLRTGRSTADSNECGSFQCRDEFHLAAIVQNLKPWHSEPSGLLPYYDLCRLRKLQIGAR